MSSYPDIHSFGSRAFEACLQIQTRLISYVEDKSRGHLIITAQSFGEKQCGKFVDKDRRNLVFGNNIQLVFTESEKFFLEISRYLGQHVFDHALLRVFVGFGSFYIPVGLVLHLIQKFPFPILLLARTFPATDF